MKNTSETVKSEHAPTPWVIHERTGRYHITPHDNEFLTCAAASGFNNQEAQANAHFIVTACNAHDVLLDACKALLARVKYYTDGTETCDLGVPDERAIAKAEYAISLAATT